MVTEGGTVEVPGSKSGDVVVSEMGNVGAEIGRGAKIGRGAETGRVAGAGRDFFLGIGRSMN